MLQSSIVKPESGVLQIRLVSLRKYGRDKHNSVMTHHGGGAGSPRLSHFTIAAICWVVILKKNA